MCFSIYVFIIFDISLTKYVIKNIIEMEWNMREMEWRL